MASTEPAAGAVTSAPSSSGTAVGKPRLAPDAVFALLEPVIENLDTQIRATRGSQILLRDQITEMAEFLHKVSSGQAGAPYDLALYSRKLADCRRRATNVGNVLNGVHDRLSKLQREMARDIYRKKTAIEGRPPTPPAH